MGNVIGAAREQTRKELICLLETTKREVARIELDIQCLQGRKERGLDRIKSLQRLIDAAIR